MFFQFFEKILTRPICIFGKSMSISKFLLLSDSMGASLSLPETCILSIRGARANDNRLTDALNALQPGHFFIWWQRPQEWKRRQADSPEAVSTFVIHIQLNYKLHNPYTYATGLHAFTQVHLTNRLSIFT